MQELIKINTSEKGQQLLEAAINHYGPGDIRTLELSQQRDKEIVVKQKEIYKKYKEVV